MLTHDYNFENGSGALMFMYERHSVVHGRPWPLKGKYYAAWMHVNQAQLFNVD